MSRAERYFAGVLGLFAAAILSGWLAGCAHTPVLTSGIPHLLQVNKPSNVWRSGQPPATTEAWAAIQGRGVTNVVQLDELTEGSDSMALLIGIQIQHFPISLWAQTVGRPNDVLMHMAVRAITWNTLIHCVHGNDRTGLLVALWRLSQGWSKADAQAEMWANGFSGEPGLLAYWLEQRVEDWRR